MCPACIVSAAWLIAGAGSTGGLAVLIATKLSAKTDATKSPARPTSNGIYKVKSKTRKAASRRSRCMARRTQDAFYEGE